MPSQTPRHRHSPHLLMSGLFLALLGLASLGSLPASARPEQSEPGRPGAVLLTDGRVLEGNVVEHEREVVVTTRGIATTVSRDQVARIEWGTPEERLARRLEALAPEDYAARLDIADEAIRRDLLDFAEPIVQDVLQQVPNHPRARPMLELIAQQRRVDRLQGTGRRPARQQVEEAPGRAVRPGPRNVLNDEQINMIRQAELQEADALAGRDRPRIAFQNNVVRRFVDATPGLEFRQFNRLDDVTRALTIIREGPEDLHSDVRITSDPIAILTYLREVEPIVLNGCATSACHGGAAASEFVLFRNPRDDLATRYTNFYILNTATVELEAEADAFGEAPARRRLVDRQAPESSLLLEFMLRPDRAINPHPPVEGYNGMVQTRDAAHYVTVQRWISEFLRPFMGHGYGFEFRPDLSRQGQAQPDEGEAGQADPPENTGNGSDQPPPDDD